MARILLVLVFCAAGAGVTSAGETPSERWLSRFKFELPAAAQEGVCSGTIGDLPKIEAASQTAGAQLVRVSVPFKPGALPCELGVKARCGDSAITPDLRILTRHPGRPASVRRAILTFPADFDAGETKTFALALAPQPPSSRHELVEESSRWAATLGDASVSIAGDGVAVSLGGESFNARFVGPATESGASLFGEVIEWGSNYCWIRVLQPDTLWPRIIEVRIDSTGNVAVQAHLQRLGKGDATAPEMGWEVVGPELDSAVSHSFAEGASCTVAAAGASVSFPTAACYRRGRVDALNDADGGKVRYVRCTPDEKVPFQESAWRSAAIVISKPGATPLNSLLEPCTQVRVAGVAGSEAKSLDLWPVLSELDKYTCEAICASMLRGDDYGNVTCFQRGGAAGAFGMNRLNHCGSIFELARARHSRALRETALLWCMNMYDLSIWWADAEEFGGTRYNNAVVQGSKEHEGDNSFMWRGNNAVGFCTKGFENFFHAYEETGDPRMSTALRAQTSYAERFIHTDQGQCRNIGDVADFMALYEVTGLTRYLDEALRLFRELRTKLSAGDLFSQGGEPIVEDGPFIDDDEAGYRAPFAKPYIIGYALAGLPDLLRACPAEPRLRDVVRAAADFLASSQDPSGGWRYPHPQSSRLLFSSIEHAAQICQAAKVLEERGEEIGHLVDAVERNLQQRVCSFERSGKILTALSGWEFAPGNIQEGLSIYDLYDKPADRDPARDYTEGQVSLGLSPPEALVYFAEALEFYMAHRPAERLFHPNKTLRLLLERMPARSEVPARAPAPPVSCGVTDNLPHFRDEKVARMDFPLAYDRAGMAFGQWRKRGREVFMNCLPPRPPLAPFQPQILAVEDRGAYEARKMAINLSVDTRATAYLLVPKGEGPFPAVLALHDHGAHFSIGKEKVVRPIGESKERVQDAQDWVGQCYEGVFIGDELASRGYVVFAAAAAYWGDRGHCEEDDSYEGQQAFAANLFQLGSAWAGMILWDDIRCAEFVQGLAEVHPERIGAVGLSMGSNRTWHLAAATDIIKAGAAICWMGDTPTLTTPGNNQTTGQSAYSMLYPGLRNFLDYPDVASLACPKPMLFYNGTEDGLFPVSGVKACYDKLRLVWREQGCGDRLVTKLWNVPHVFNREMQAEAFDWLDKQLKP